MTPVRMAIQTERPLLLVVDDDRAMLTLVGTGLSCLDVLRALRTMNPYCEAVLRTGFDTLDAAVEALRHNIHAEGTPGGVRFGRGLPSISPVEVERDHIVRTLGQVRGNKTMAARLLGVSRRAFYRQLERHGLHRRVGMGRYRGTSGMPVESA